MITLIAIAQIADLLNDSRDKYTPRAEKEFYESVGSSRLVRFATLLTAPRLSAKTLRSRTAKPSSARSDQAACLARS
ncbi:hypothetical protein J2W42_001065 [Rhizobium tibeticum]|uniref:Uncharacterized protein n=1 Tax=Rhizobium tibeticum TaxID=501024 RepID=A0A1H8CRC2_9HYPH|nr:hypothetical protein [Rhizobium tibeticum]SEH49592.1 hypothetical protein RTCCBAU85039_0716 [Rhizobium tibeticum]SEM97560.1 hypothetical protein SAMN05216228_1001268 [Rhizobium tibeticum]